MQMCNSAAGYIRINTCYLRTGSQSRKEICRATHKVQHNIFEGQNYHGFAICRNNICRCRLALSTSPIHCECISRLVANP